MKNSLLLIALLATTISFGQTAKPIEEKPFIEVVGTADQEVTPDEIYINIVIRERYANREKITIETQEEDLKSALRGIGIDIKNLYLSDANADYVKVKWRTKDVLTKKEYTLKVNTATSVGEVFQLLDKIEITDAYIGRVNHSKLDSLKKENKIKAIKAAKEKADYLLAAIGEQAGKPLIIQERDNAYINPVTANYTNRLDEVVVAGYGYNQSRAKSEDQEIQFKKIKIQSSIYIKYLIR